MVKNLPANAGDVRGTDSIPGSGRSPGKFWLPIPVFLPGEPHRQRSLVGYSPWGYKELDMNDGLTLSPRLGNTHQYPKIYSYFYLWKEKLKSEKE